jgi:glycosyltransferase involved in cell wall biosynthesis
MTIPVLHIAFDAKRYFFNQTGLGVYSRSLIEALHQHIPEVNITLAASHLPKSMSSDLLKAQGLDIMMNSGIYPNWYWRSFKIASLLKQSDISIYHGLSHEIPFGIHKTRVKSVVTVHDLLFLDFPQDYAWHDRQIYYHKMKYALKVADRIVAISSYTKKRILHHFDVDPDQIVVIPPIAESTFWFDDSNPINTDSLQSYNLPQNYFLFVGSWGMRKNLQAVIKALELLNWPLPLVVLGKQGKLLEGDFNQKMVHFINGLERIELKSLYKKSNGLLFPSIAEGFGLPVLEALMCGIPVLTSKDSAMSEVANELALLVDPLSVEDIASCILKLNDAFPDRQKVQELVSRFSPENTSMELYQLYQSII